jgi:hypothetical protein
MNNEDAYREHYIAVDQLCTCCIQVKIKVGMIRLGHSDAALTATVSASNTCLATSCRDGNAHVILATRVSAPATAEMSKLNRPRWS